MAQARGIPAADPEGDAGLYYGPTANGTPHGEGLLFYSDADAGVFAGHFQAGEMRDGILVNNSAFGKGIAWVMSGGGWVSTSRATDTQVRVAAEAITRAINKNCVTVGAAASVSGIHPADNVCFRGGGFDDRYRDFFAVGREFRQPAFLATSFAVETAQKFIRMRGDTNCVMWIIRIDPERKCRHVNLVKRVVPGLADEQEYLFAPYSAFLVLSASWKAGTADDPHIIELLAAVDNQEASEELPLAPWS